MKRDASNVHVGDTVRVQCLCSGGSSRCEYSGTVMVTAVESLRFAGLLLDGECKGEKQTWVWSTARVESCDGLLDV